MDKGTCEGQCQDLTPSLVGQLRAGDARAGELLNSLYRRPMFRFCWGYLGSDADAEDAVQEVFCKVLTATAVPSNFRAWLYKIARNHCSDILRDRVRKGDAEVLPPASQLGADLTGDLTRLARREQRLRIYHLVSALPTTQREALRLRYVEGLSRDEMAYVLDVPVEVVKSRIFEGLKNLRKHTSLLDDM